MSHAPPVKHRCNRCGVAVEIHFDHVGDCDAPGKCNGTFDHPRAVRYCPHSGRTVTHRDVTSHREW